MSDAAQSSEGGAPGLLGAYPAPAKAVVRFLQVTGQLICVGTLATLFLALFSNVILRYFFGSGLDWAYDIHSILFPWMIAAGAVLASIYGRQIAIPLLIEISGPTVARMIFVVANLLTASISLGVAWSSIPIIRAAQYQRIEALGGISQLWGYLSITYAFVGIAIICVFDLVTVALRLRPVPVNSPSNEIG